MRSFSAPRRQPFCEEFRVRAHTDERGQYEFMSILPARYNNGGQLRPRHIHFRVHGAQHEELVTQLYFADDAFIAADPWASRADAGRIIPLVENEGVLQGDFDLFLQPV